MTTEGDTQKPVDSWDLAVWTTRTLNIYLQMKGGEERVVVVVVGFISSRKAQLKTARVQFRFKVSHNRQFCRCSDANTEHPDPKGPIRVSKLSLEPHSDPLDRPVFTDNLAVHHNSYTRVCTNSARLNMKLVSGQS